MSSLSKGPGSKPVNFSDGISKRNVRQLAAEILLRVDTAKAYADILLDHRLKSATLDSRDRALLTELVYGTLRWRGRLDAKLAPRLRRPLADTDPYLRNLLRLALYQLLFLDKIPDFAAVNEAVKLAKIHAGSKAAGFVNGVLRAILRAMQEDSDSEPKDQSITALAAHYSHPEWLVKKWLDYFGQDQARALMRTNNGRAGLVLRANLLRCRREQLLQCFAESGVKAVASELSPQGIRLKSGTPVAQLPGFKEGLFQVQSEASQLIAYLLSALPGERILDACAAPGGKATQITELMEDRGEVIAADRSPQGIARIEGAIARLGMKSIRAVCADASRELAGDLSGPYDRILVDAPCSGLGTLRSHPEIKWQRSEKDTRRLSHLQLKILRSVAPFLKPGGVLVYSTCTLSREENETVAEIFLGAHKEFELQDAAGYLPVEARHMVRGRYFLALPHRDDTDGFFAARMRKVA